MKANRITTAGLLACAFLAGCASNVPLDNSKAAPVESRTPNTGKTGAGSTSPTQVAKVDLTKNASSSELARIVYFDYDSFVIKDEFRSVVESQAKALSSDRAKKVQIEGHTDERGGSEYNLALGQKRAESVAKALKLLGVNDNQVEAVSFGKERPAVQGSDEAAWAKNRRAELNNR
ncbi:MAG TPA: peptidoglycan-associated lipoprotein Pal [Rhizobacter sp.]|jgi:peptidoglycan-associated lipoprotein|nr:peptidoglycan-associated lipoprotein Pal [Rhizobacter sp.]